MSSLPVTEEVGYFQTGTYGPTLPSALKAVRDAMEYEALHGPARPETRQHIMEKEEAARGHLADLLNVDPEELGISSNTTRAMHRVLRSFDWGEGDEFVTTSLEHVSTADASARAWNRSAESPSRSSRSTRATRPSSSPSTAR